MLMIGTNDSPMEKNGKTIPSGRGSPADSGIPRGNPRVSGGTSLPQSSSENLPRTLSLVRGIPSRGFPTGATRSFS